METSEWLLGEVFPQVQPRRHTEAEPLQPMLTRSHLKHAVKLGIPYTRDLHRLEPRFQKVAEATQHGSVSDFLHGPLELDVCKALKLKPML